MLSKYPIEAAEIGTVLRRRATEYDTVIYIERGNVALGIKSDTGSAAELTHRVGQVKGPAWLDPAAATLNVPSVLDAVTQTEVLLRRIPYDQFNAIFDSCESHAQLVLNSIARAALEQTEFVVGRLSKDAEARFSEWMLENAHSCTDGSMYVQLLPNKKSVARELGIASETLSRVLTNLRERKIIEGKGLTITLKSVSRVRRLAGNTISRK